MRRWMVVLVLGICGAVHAGEQSVPDSFKTYKRVDSVGSLYLAGTITPRTFKKKMETMDGLEDVIHASFDANKINFTIRFDPGPSGDPSYEITALRDGKSYVTSIGADRLFISAEGALYAEGRANRYFNLRQKFVLNESGFQAIPQPFYLVDEECPLEADLSLTSEPCGKGRIIALLPKGSKAHILAAPPTESCSQGERQYNDPLPFLVKTPFGLIGWAQTQPGSLATPGSPLACIRFMGD